MEDKDAHYLYKVTNLLNGKGYIGVTKHPELRKAAHLKHSKGSLLNKAVAKYGADNFEFKVICIGSCEYIYDLEDKVIELYNTRAVTGQGYNVVVGGIGGKGNYNKSVDSPVFVSGFWFPNKKTSLQSLNWGVGQFNSRKKSNVLGNVQYEYKKGPQEPVYVGGFWFPSKKCAIQHTSLTASTYELRRKSGHLGLTLDIERRVMSYYFRGFWFRSLKLASDKTGVSKQQIRRLIVKGLVEEDISQFSKVRKKCYSVFGVIYKTLDQASAQTGIPVSNISYNILNNKEGFTHAYSI